MEAKLNLKIENFVGKSAVVYSKYNGSLKVGTPNYYNERLSLVIMMASAGILKGDDYQYEITCGNKTKTIITEQSYTKIFNTGLEGAKKHVNIRLEGNASLFYRPSPVIPFEGSCFSCDSVINLDKNSEFLCTDIFASGRIGMGEKFAFSKYRNRICVFLDNKPIWLDNCFLDPDNMDLRKLVFFDGYTHQGTLFYYGFNEKEQELLEYETKSPVLFGKTSSTAGVCIRVLANTAQDIEEEFDRIEQMILR